MSKWETVKIGTLCDAIFSGGTPKTAEPSYWDGDLLWLSSGETRNRYIFTTDRTITQEGVDNSSTRLALKGDIVMACAGQGNTRGQTSVVMRDMYINQSVIALRANPKKLHNLYLFHSLSSRYDELRAKSDASSTRGSITTDMLKKLPISIPTDDPDLRIQTRIANILSAYDDAIENNNRRIDLLEKAAQELYKEWFVRFRFPGHESARFVNGLPVGWTVKRMATFTHVTDGTHDTPKPTDAGVPLVTGRCISNGFIDFDSAYLISEVDHAGISKRSGLETGDILFSNIGTVGSTCIVDYYREFSVKNVIIFKPESEAKTTYLYLLLTSQSMQDIFQAQTNGASQQFVGLTFMRRFKIVVPSEELLLGFSERVSPLLAERQLLHKKSQNLARQRDMLLPRLMSGKLEV
ncbi:MAG: restriction endonuclease subunit S [Peptococcaceae bacterium]|nr:restriction endonuclease subunit S [Peptococcaceae bacterium]